MTVKTEYLLREGKMFAYVRVREKTDSYCLMAGKRYEEISNIREPFDFKLHIFELPEKELRSEGKYTVVTSMHGKRKSDFFTDTVKELAEQIEFDESQIRTIEEVNLRSNRGLRFEKVYDSGCCEGMEWKCELYRTPADEPVRVYTMFADPAVHNIICGTPHMAPEFKAGDIQTVMEECEAAEGNGLHVLGAANADFFDMFGDCHPSGLCVANGICVANPDTPNPFFAITRDGEPVIGFKEQYPVDTLAEAVGGGHIIVKDGKLFETAPLEGFGEIAHPRTAYGLTSDGKVIITVVDGRRPVWSNGAALSELGGLMIEHGAVIALNTDGGGSSTFIVRKNDNLEMLNHPADLARPMEDLIRPLFDTLIVCSKE